MQRVRFFLCLILLVAGFGVAVAQDDEVLIHIKLVDGRTGLPMKVKMLSMGAIDRRVQREIPLRPDADGVATVKIGRAATIYDHNTLEYMDCGDDRGGRHPTFQVSEIAATGIAEPIAQPSQCAKAFGSAKPGELILFVRPLEPGEGEVL